MLEEKFTYVLHATGKYLRPDLKQQFEALLTPTNLGIFAGTLVIWAAGHFFGVSEVVDVVLGVAGVTFLGLAVFQVGEYLGRCIELTCSATTKEELEEAANDLAEAIALIGVVAFIALLMKAARIFGKGGKGGD